MATRPVGFESFTEGTRLRAVRMSLDDARFALEGIGALVVSQSQRAFQMQRLGNATWKSRGDTGMNPNWPAILADLSAGRTPPDRRFRDRPALMDRGTLRNSIAKRIVDSTSVEVGSRLPYAAVLHAGGESQSVPITQELQGKLWKWIKARRGGAKRSGASESTKARGAGADKLRWLLNPHLRGTRLTIEHPARPIVGLPRQLVADIESLYGRRIAEVA
jgi:phage gpG-like protein